MFGAALALFAALLGPLCSATFTIKLKDIHYHDGPVPPSPINAPGIKAGDRIIVKDIGSCTGTRGRQTHRNTNSPNVDRFPFQGCVEKAEFIRRYEENNCNGSSTLSAPYFQESEVPTIFQVTNVQNHTYLGQTYRRVDLSPNSIPIRTTLKQSGESKWYCNQVNGAGNTWQPTLIASTSSTDSSNTCPYTTDAACKGCAWPYLAKADTLNCGCRIDYSAYQPKSDLMKYAYAYCQTAGNDGTQYYLDQSRSNFEATRGEIVGACSSPTAGTTVYIPAATCPAPRVDTTISDTGQQIPLNPIPRPTISGSGSGSGSDTGTHSRLDTILGCLRDTAGLGNKLDTLRSWDSAQNAAMGDTVGARESLRDLDSMIAGIPGSDGPCVGCNDPWRCDRIPNDSIVFDLLGSHFSIPLSFSDVVSGLPFDFWAVLRLLEWLMVTVLMLGPWLWIAGANVGKGGS